MTASGQTNIDTRAEVVEATWTSVLCPLCGAKPGQDCRTDTGEPAATHAARKRMASYKPVPAVTR